jgi:hypothetical protein
MASGQRGIVSTCPGNPGCRCRECYGLPEWLAQHGLDARGMGPTRTAPPFEPTPVAVVAPEPPPAPRAPARQPWDARPARAA